MTLEEESATSADSVITALSGLGHDYSGKRDGIIELFGRLYRGNWDCSTSFEDGTQDLRLIQEDEFDQHADDDMPDHDDQLCYAAGHYVFFA